MFYKIYLSSFVLIAMLAAAGCVTTHKMPQKQCPLPKAGQPPMCDHAIASASNVDGVVLVEDPNAAKLYTIQKDDTLQKISEKVYGSFNSWTLIYEANRDVIKDPNFLTPGTVLNIPPQEESPSVK